MDALILSCGTGGGHDAAAYAVQDAFLARGAKAVVLNPYSLKSEKTACTIDHAYIGVVQRTPGLFGVAYAAANVYRRLPIRSPIYFCNRKMAEVLGAYLDEHPCDVIVTTHLFPAEILTQMKRQGMPVPKSIFVATDYTCIPFTEETECDAYVIPTADHTVEYLRRGIPTRKLYPLGIPVRAAFGAYARMSQTEAKEQLGLDPACRYVVMCGGSMGAGSLDGIIRRLLERVAADVRLIVICGSNQKLYEKLTETYGDAITTVGYTDRMPLYMRACDLFMTKPGGLSSTEAAVMGVPLVHLPPIPGCESVNRRFFVERSISVEGDRGQDHIEGILALLESPAEKARIVQNQHRTIPSDSAQNIYRLALRLTASR